MNLKQRRDPEKDMCQNTDYDEKAQFRPPRREELEHIETKIEDEREQTAINKKINKH